MAIPMISEECIVAVLHKIASDTDGAVDWTRRQAAPMTEEQPFLMQLIVQTIERIHEVSGCQESVPQEISTMQTVHTAMLTYQLVKAAVEGEQLDDMYSTK